MSIDDSHLKNGPVAALGAVGPVMTSDLEWGIGEVPDDNSCEVIPRLFCWISPDHQRARARQLASLTSSRRG